jgi:inner membrane protein
MDSLTQITLGAAVGEAVLGRKIGNRAIIWGAIGGTIPDLDIIANFFLEPIPALAFHRAITHSLFFSVTIGALLAWLVHRLYLTRTHQKSGYKLFISIFNVVLLSAIFFGLFTLFGKNILFGVVLGLMWIYLIWRLYHFYLRKNLEEVNVSFSKWYLLFFLALATHVLLDCFTAFGTQVFQPFSNYRVAFDNIAIIDPVYTVPFILCVIIASAIRRKKPARSIINWIGLSVSSLYMLLTIINKNHVDNVFEKALANRGLETSRCRTSPVIFSNVLWNCVAESDSVYYAGLYSIFDSDPNLHFINVVPKDDHLANEIRHLDEYKTLQWFSDNYLIHGKTDSAIVIADIRYGGMTDTIKTPEDLVFNFYAKQQPDGSYYFSETRKRPDDLDEAFKSLWKRMLGN